MSTANRDIDPTLTGEWNEHREHSTFEEPSTETTINLGKRKSTFQIGNFLNAHHQLRFCFLISPRQIAAALRMYADMLDDMDSDKGAR